MNPAADRRAVFGLLLPWVLALGFSCSLGCTNSTYQWEITESRTVYNVTSIRDTSTGLEAYAPAGSEKIQLQKWVLPGLAGHALTESQAGNQLTIYMDVPKDGTPWFKVTFSRRSDYHNYRRQITELHIRSAEDISRH